MVSLGQPTLQTKLQPNVQSVLQVPQPPSAHSTVRFAEKPAVKVAKFLMASLDRVSPRMAARITYNIISAPPRYRPKSDELKLRAQALQWRIPFQDGWLQAYRWGDGPTCLFVHCWGGRGTQAWTLIQRLLDSGLSVVSFDHPAHGQSSGKRAEMVRMAAAVACVADTIGPIHTLIGHSLGVAASAIALRDYPIKIDKLISISSLTHCVWFTEVIGDYLGISRSTLARARRIVDSNYAKPVNWEGLSVLEILRPLNLPTLLIHDQEDPEIPFHHALQLHQALPWASFLATSGLGHRRVLKDEMVMSSVTQFALPINTSAGRSLQ